MLNSCSDALGILEETNMKRPYNLIKIFRCRIKYVIQARGRFGKKLNWPRAFFVSTKNCEIQL